MVNLKILIADDDQYVASGLEAMLQNLGHTVVGCAHSGADAVNKANELAPDLVIMDIRMDDMDGLEASRLILEQRSLPIVILSAFTERELIRQADDIGVSGYMVKPISQNELQPALTLAWSRFKQLQKLKREIGNLQEMLRSRKLVEQAKGLLMEREGLTESDAFKRIQKMSRNQNISMARLAEAIIMSYRVIGPNQRSTDHDLQNRSTNRASRFTDQKPDLPFTAHDGSNLG